MDGITCHANILRRNCGVLLLKCCFFICQIIFAKNPFFFIIGEYHSNNPEMSKLLHKAVRQKSESAYSIYQQHLATRPVNVSCWENNLLFPYRSCSDYVVSYVVSLSNEHNEKLMTSGIYVDFSLFFVLVARHSFSKLIKRISVQVGF